MSEVEPTGQCGCMPREVAKTSKRPKNLRRQYYDKSSAVAGMGDRGHSRHGPKEGGATVPLSRGELGPRPSNTMWPGPRSTSVPSDVFIHPAVWPG